MFKELNKHPLGPFDKFRIRCRNAGFWIHRPTGFVNQFRINFYQFFSDISRVFTDFCCIMFPCNTHSVKAHRVQNIITQMTTETRHYVHASVNQHMSSMQSGTRQKRKFNQIIKSWFRTIVFWNESTFFAPTFLPF